MSNTTPNRSLPREQQSEERLEILSMLEDGVVSIDEAADLFEVLGQGAGRRIHHEQPIPPKGGIVSHHDEATTGRGETRIPIDLSQPLALDVRTAHGNVAIRAVDRSDVLVTSGGLGVSGAPDESEPAVTIDARGNRIEVRPHPNGNADWLGIGHDFDLENVIGHVAEVFRHGKPFVAGRPGRARLGFGGADWADVEIEIPKAVTAQVAVHAASGDVRIEDVTGDIALQTMSGDQRVSGSHGRLSLRAASGDMAVEGASGPVNAHAASGDIRLSAAEMPEFQIHTASGDVSLDATLAGNGPFAIKTASGDVRLALRTPAAAGDEPALSLAFQTVAGDARVGPPLRKIGRRRWQSGNESGSAHVDVTTVNGDLTATLAATETMEVPAPSPAVFPAGASGASPAPHANVVHGAEDAASGSGWGDDQRRASDSAHRLAVLEAVERGEIDIDEALLRLDAADVGANA